MDKNTLKALVTEMYENLLIKIDEQDEATKEQIIEYLRNAASAISSINDNKLEKISSEKSLYRRIQINRQRESSLLREHES